MKLKQIIFNVVAAFALMLTPAALATGTVHAFGLPSASPPPPSCGNANTAKGQVLQGVGLAGNDCDDKQVDQTFQTVVQLLSMIVGIVSVIAIMYAGLKYMTSGGESGKVSNAKNTLLYALVGLAVASLAQLLIHFVLFQVNKK